ncbi:hypothetical protein [Flavobacterium sp. HNIBRBA15423]|uniref:hypothetical protein n=1 Tax=Flavobacterium sp. HNIBRBA15423 TaxID=3458683 RepID=UPI004043D53F
MIRKFVFSFCILLLISILVFTSIYNYLFTSCPEMNSEYFAWFPYKEGDILIFESQKNKEIKLEVSFLELVHTNAYMNFVKCGHCEDSEHIIFRNEKDTLDITMNNLDNPKSYFGYQLNLVSNSKFVNHIQKDSTINNKNKEVISSDSYLFIKSRGLVNYKMNNTVYYFKKIIRKNLKKQNIKGGC